MGPVAAKGTPLAVALARMLRVPATWEGLATDLARDLVARCLRKLTGHKDFREFAAEIGAMARPEHGRLG